MKPPKYKSIVDLFTDKPRTLSEQDRLEDRANRIIDSFKYHVDTDNLGPNSQDVIDWCEKNCQGRFSTCWSLYMFKNQEDAVLFQLTWLNE